MPSPLHSDEESTPQFYSPNSMDPRNTSLWFLSELEIYFHNSQTPKLPNPLTNLTPSTEPAFIPGKQYENFDRGFNTHFSPSSGEVNTPRGIK